MALEYGPFGVTSNILTPGAIAGTEGMERLSSKGSEERLSKGVPSGRMGNVRDIADATVYLFSDAGNYPEEPGQGGAEYYPPPRAFGAAVYSNGSFFIFGGQGINGILFPPPFGTSII